jgi:hypothetical protein
MASVGAVAAFASAFNVAAASADTADAASLWTGAGSVPIALNKSGKRFKGSVNFSNGRGSWWKLCSGEAPKKAKSNYALEHVYHESGWPLDSTHIATEYGEWKPSYSKQVLEPSEGLAGATEVRLQLGSIDSQQNFYEREKWKKGSKVAFIDCSDKSFGSYMPKTNIPTFYFKVSGLQDNAECGISPLLFWVLVPLINMLLDLGFDVLVNCNVGANR